MRRLNFSLVTFLGFVFIASGIVWSAEDSTYRIGRSDILEITVWQSPDLTKTVTVDSDGTVAYPILGNIPAAGFTPKYLEKMIQEKLSQGYVKDPRVSVVVKEYNSKKILVFGEVQKPGLYRLKEKIPLLELLFMVGGGKPDAKRMTVIRPLHVGVDAIPTALLPSSEESDKTDTAKAIEVDLIALLSKGDLSQNIMIFPGDTIYVSSGTGQRYYVLGQVKNPGPYEWVQDITVLEAVKLAGGPTPRAALNRMTVRQNRGGQEQVLKLNIMDVVKGKKKDDAVVKAGDVIVVPESWL